MRIIVSVASYNTRYENLHMCIESLLKQTHVPDNVILNIPGRQSDLPQNVLRLQDYGVIIHSVKRNLRSHNKYYYSMINYPEDIIITVDDDCIYSFDLIESLLAAYYEYPNCIIAGRAHGILLDKKGDLLPYLQWDWESKHYNCPSMSLIATGIGGILYPPHSLPTEIFNTKNIIRFCPFQDDIWLKVMEVLYGTKVVLIKRDTVKPQPVPGTENTGLYYYNKPIGNDKSLEQLTKFYGIKWREVLLK